MLTPQMVQIITTQIWDLMTKAGIPQDTKQMFWSMIDPNNRPVLAGELTQLIEQNFTAQNWQTGIHPQALAKVVWPWVNMHCDQIERQLRPAAQPGYGNQGFYGNNNGGYGGGYGGGITYQGPAAGYGSAPPALYGNDIATPARRQEQPRYESRSLYGQPAPTNNQPANEEQTGVRIIMPQNLQFSTVKTVGLKKAMDGSGIFTLEAAQHAEYEHVRYGINHITYNRAMNTMFDTTKQVFRVLPPEFSSGYYLHIVDYKRLTHLAIGTKEFSAIVDNIYSETESKDLGWEEILEMLIKLNRQEFSVIDKFLTPIINDLMFTNIRIVNSNKISISTIEDLPDLLTFDNGKATRHANYHTRIRGLITEVFRWFFDPQHIIRADDKHFGDFVNCDEINFFENGYTEYDYGMLSDKDEKAKFIDRLQEKSTVLRLPERYLITNTQDDFNIRRADSMSLNISNDEMNPLNTLLRQFNSMDQLTRRVICLEKGIDSRQTILKFGVNLDGDPILYGC